MHEIRVERTLRAPVEHVFELISDHAGYRRFRGITSSELVREGNDEPNGVGAIRRIASGPIRFEEEITAFERPNRMDYLIRSVNLPIEHEGGSILMKPRSEGETEVVWISRFESTAPVLGRAFGSMGVRTTSRGFNWLLSGIESAYAR